ncbi:MAG: isoprenylcysteine carboxylmethyltransferase family protein [candidate division WOR-3 bacterium]
MYKIGNFLFKKRGIIIFLIIFLLLFFSKPNLFRVIVSIPFFILGETIRIYSLIYSGGFTRSRNLNAPFLLKDGPYSVTRNPLYFGNLFNLLGMLIAMNLNFFISLLSFLIFFTIYFLIILAEERFLEKKFGEEYILYKKNVPRIFPNPFKFKPAKPLNNFSKVMRIERDTLISIFIFYLLIFLILWKKNF